MRKTAALLWAGTLLLLAAGCASNGEETVRNSIESPVEKENAQEKVTVPPKETGQAAGNRYTWNEVTILLPKSWEGCYTVEETEDVISFFQTASYQADGGTGFVWGLFRSKNDLAENEGGEQLVAFTVGEDKIFYYSVMPLDVDCGSEDDKVLGEYIRMCNEAPLLAATLEIEGAFPHAWEYILPASDLFLLSGEEISTLSDNELWIARNEIYARHGVIFEDGYLQRHFERCAWYEGTIPLEDFDDGTGFSRLERQNHCLLVDAEQAYHVAHPYPKQYGRGEMVYEDLDGDGSLEEILYQVNGESGCTLTVNGTVYSVSEINPAITEPMWDCFYITDISEEDGMLEIAVLDEGPSEDPQTFFFYYRDGELFDLGVVPGFPFAEFNWGINGFDGHGNIKGRVRMDLIETVYLTDHWKLDRDIPRITYPGADLFRDLIPTEGHELYVDLPVRYFPEETSSFTTIPAQKQVFFLSSDMYQWILVQGRDGSMGYMLVEDGIVTDLDKPADEVFSDLHFSD